MIMKEIAVFYEMVSTLILDDHRVKERKPSVSAGPKGWDKISREEAMQIHPEAEQILKINYSSNTTKG